MPFEIIPAIDLLGQRVVQLAQGDYDRASDYGGDPGAVAKGYREAGALRIHVVDLDGARSGKRENADCIRAIVAGAGDVPVQLGGGIRDLDGVEAALALGVSRVILGTAALRDPVLVREAARLHPGAVVVGIDARGGRVAVEGWLETSDAEATELARHFEGAGVAALVYTDIDRDGVFAGPNLDETHALAREVSIPVIASGGVGSDADVDAALATPDIAGLIVGTALYEGKVDLARALARAQELACS